MRRLLCGAILLLLLAASSAPALAQVHGGDFWAGLGAGIGLPQGDAKEVYGQGYSASAFVLVTVLSRPSGGLSLRAEGHGLLSKAKEFDGISGDARVLAIGGAVEVHLETGSVRPYLVGGGGELHLPAPHALRVVRGDRRGEVLRLERRRRDRGRRPQPDLLPRGALPPGELQPRPVRLRPRQPRHRVLTPGRGERREPRRRAGSSMAGGRIR